MLVGALVVLGILFAIYTHDKNKGATQEPNFIGFLFNGLWNIFEFGGFLVALLVWSLPIIIIIWSRMK
jgi:hypothetical protein